MTDAFFDIALLEQGESEHRFVWNPRQLELSYPGANFDDDVVLHLVCMRRGLEISCTGWVTTEVTLTCSRCLKTFTYALREPVAFSVRLRAGAPLVVELWDEDVVSVDQTAGRLILSPRIHDAVILGIPTQPLCSPNCKGLCPVCGANLNEVDCGHTPQTNIDPRWEKLKALLKKR